MTEHKFTDEEVIKALECHKDYWADNCFECPYQSMLWLPDNNCVAHLSKDALDLINRQREEIEELRKHKHGLTHTRLYSIWKGMRQRCFSPQYKGYKSYGARGITICREWDDFLNFYNWAMANGYADNLSIDRIDVNGNYCPENCRWADSFTQSKNRRFTQLTFNGETHTIEEWSQIIGITNSGIRYRIQKNYPIEKILAPKKKGGCI